MNYFILFLFIYKTALGENLYPHPGVRFVYEDTPVYSADKSSNQIDTLKSHSAIVPCVVTQNGEPALGAKGEVLVGYTKKIFEESSAPGPFGENDLLSIVTAYQDLASQRNEKLKDLEAAKKEFTGKKIKNNDCIGEVLGLVPLSALSPKDMSIMYPPAPNAATGLVDIANKFNSIGKAPEDCNCFFAGKGSSPIKLLTEFHNSPLCLSAELQVGNRKDAFLKAWDAFVKNKIKEDPALEKELKMAEEIDLATRTALYEGDHARGCSAKGICEKDIVLLSIRNRAQTKPCKNYGCEFKGDVVGVATKESQYNIWSDFFTDITYMSSCFMRVDRHPSTPTSEQAAWSSDKQKTTYQRMVKMFEETALRAEDILYADNEKLSSQFNGIQPKDISKLRHYYHPPAMTKCYPQFQNRQFVSEAYVLCGENYHFIRKDSIEVKGSAPNGRVLFSILKSDDLGTSDPIDDQINFEDEFSGCTIDPARITPAPEVHRCSVYGLPPKEENESKGCDSSGAKYYRTYPNWIIGAALPEITCNNVQSKGDSCDAPLRVENAQWGGSCDRQMMPALGVL